ncbi:hypothetical protein SCOCK_50256 [Actinacidiphila cocklensis]|uniref:Uncharacterized protein n=1 Tax=Actinacidiphila cocklensis TaxID=887465 RepID=A0A9W4GVZ2_9ACTN|nr:hypothetical protein SCOCK_50256 [Actinacidiphila cocklensis]
MAMNAVAPGRLRTSADPLWAVAPARTIAGPRPAPWPSGPGRVWSARAKRSTTVSQMTWGLPGAVVLDHEAGGRLVLPEPDGDPAAEPGVQPGVSEQVPGDPAGAVAGRRPS